MTKLLSLAAVIGVSFFCVAAAQSMPLSPLEQAQASLTIPVAGGCAWLSPRPVWRLPSQRLLRRRVLRRRCRARRGGSARCGGGSARRGGSPAGRFVSSLQRVSMLVCLLIELKNVVASGGRVLRTRPLRF